MVTRAGKREVLSEVAVATQTGLPQEASVY